MRTIKLQSWIATFIIISLSTSGCHKETVSSKTPKAIQRIINKEVVNYATVEEYSYKNTNIYLFWESKGYVVSGFKIFDKKGNRIIKDDHDSSICIGTLSKECSSYMTSLTYNFKNQIKYNRIIWKRS